MIYPVVTWSDPDNLRYDHIEVYAKANGGNPTDPADYVADVSIGVEQYVDPTSYGPTDRICYGLKSVTPSGVKSAFSAYFCVTLGGPEAGLANMAVVSYQASMELRASLTAGVTYMALTSYLPIMEPNAIAMIGGNVPMVLTPYPATIVGVPADVFIPGYKALAITGYQPSVASTPIIMGGGTATLAITAHAPTMGVGGAALGIGGGGTLGIGGGGELGIGED